jgi:uncharacterized membrane protein
VQLKTRQITRGALLVSLSLVLSLSRLGEIPVPTLGRAITIAHVPVILAGILLGPWVGAGVGMIWGVSQWVMYSSAFPDPLVHIAPRILVGVFSAWTFSLLYPLAVRVGKAKETPPNLTLPSAAAAVVGTVTNSVGVLSLAVMRGYLTTGAALSVGVLHLPLELAAAVVVTVPVVSALFDKRSWAQDSGNSRVT